MTKTLRYDFPRRVGACGEGSSAGPSESGRIPADAAAQRELLARLRVRRLELAGGAIPGELLGPGPGRAVGERLLVAHARHARGIAVALLRAGGGKRQSGRAIQAEMSRHWRRSGKQPKASATDRLNYSPSRSASCQSRRRALPEETKQNVGMCEVTKGSEGGWREGNKKRGRCARTRR